MCAVCNAQHQPATPNDSKIQSLTYIFASIVRLDSTGHSYTLTLYHRNSKSTVAHYATAIPTDDSKRRYEVFSRLLPFGVCKKKKLYYFQFK